MDGTWGDALAVGVASMDEAHRRHAALIDAVIASVRRGDGQHAIQDSLLRLVEETTDHFAAEQDLMRSTQFPGREAHVEEHSRLLAHLARMLDGLARGRVQLTLTLALSLRPWLTQHVLLRDSILAMHVRSSGASTLS